ncbi:MAG: hypothetical protein QM581_14445 [Pseudomonas sp.]
MKQLTLAVVLAAPLVRAQSVDANGNVVMGNSAAADAVHSIAIGTSAQVGCDTTETDSTSCEGLTTIGMSANA